jgi:DNA/RNA-binding domain of Phe-tRNA-synthetase-like protein
MTKPNEFKLIISDEIKSNFPDYNPVIFYIKNFTNNNSEISKTLLKQIQAELKATLTIEMIDNNEQIKNWRETYKSFDVNPKRVLNSCESLLNRVLKDCEIPTINPIVDIYNYISLKYLLPIGAENWDSLKSDLALKYSLGSEGFDTRDNSETVVTFPKIGEIVWADSLGTTCRCWNWRQCTRTQINKETRNMYFVIDYFGNDNSYALAAKVEMIKIIKEISPGIEVFEK